MTSLGSDLFVPLHPAATHAVIPGHTMGYGDQRAQTSGDEFVKVTEPEQSRYKTIVVREGKLVGATLLGNLGKVAFLTQAFDRGTPLPAERLSLLFDLASPPTDTSVAETADDVQVCNCNGVSKDAIRACVAAGQRSLNGVMEAT